MVKIWYAHLVGGNVALFSYFEFFSADESSNLEFLANIPCFVIIMLSFVYVCEVKTKSVEYETRNAPKSKCDCTVFIEQKTNNSCNCFVDGNIKTILDSRCGGISLYVKDDLKVNVVFNTNIVILLLPIIKNALLFLKCVLNVVMVFVFCAIINRERTKKVHLFPRRRSKFTLFTKIFKHTANDIIYFRAVKRLMEKHERCFSSMDAFNK
uniref:Uncharacterized protein n=1 Tax=Glossina palpalis gambiensis TaxID=67801 RepID=A0A1B0BV09_9MUSC